MSWVKELAKYMNQDSYCNYTFNENSKYTHIKSPVTDEVIEAHLSNKQPIAMGLAKEIDPETDERKSHFIVFDFDDHSGELMPSYVERIVRIFEETLIGADCNYFIVRSGGGKGFHIFILFATATRIDRNRNVAHTVLDKVNARDIRSHKRDETTGKFAQIKIKEGSRGVGFGEIEIFPKGSKGGSIALPLARKSFRVKYDSDNKTYIPCDAADLPINKKKKPGPKPAPSADKTVDIEAAFNAYLKNAGDASNYDTWIKIGFTVKSALGDEGYPLFLELSQNSGGFKSEADVKKKWDRELLNSRIPPEVFWAWAKKGGYTGAFPEGISIKKGDGNEYLALDLALGKALFRSREGDVFIKIGPRNLINLETKYFDRWLRNEAFNKLNIALAVEAVSLVQKTCMALAETEVDLHLRVAQKGDVIYIDRADAECSAIEVTKNGWRKITGSDDIPCYFRRSKQQALPEPREGSINDLFKFVNAGEDQQIIILTVLIKAFFTGSPTPILNMTGGYGTGKSFAIKCIRMLIDPAAAMLVGPPKDESDLLVRALHNYVISIDNARTLEKLSDPLCRLCTGGGLETRALYTNGDLFTLEAKRPIMINGIEPTKYQTDLVSRIVPVTLSAPVEILRESQLEEQFLAEYGAIFGGLLDLLVSVLKILPEVQIEKPYRLAEYMHIGEATARCMGREAGWFENWYREMLDEQQDEVTDDDPVMLALLSFVQTAAPWKGSAAELLIALEYEIQGLPDNLRFDMPRRAQQLGQRIAGLQRSLEKKGIFITKKSRQYHIQAEAHEVPF